MLWDSLTGDRTNERLVVSNGTAHFECNDGPFNYTINYYTQVSNGGSLIVGEADGGAGDVMNLTTNILFIENDGAVTVTGGSSLTANEIWISQQGGYGSLNITGAGSELIQSPLGGTKIGYDNGTGHLTIQSGASAQLQGLTEVGYSSSDSGSGLLSVYSGSNVEMSSLKIVSGNNNGQSAQVSLQGSGATITQSENSYLTVGSSSNTSGVLNLGTLNYGSGATFNTGTVGTFVYKTGEINVGGTLSTATFNANGDVYLYGGSLTVNDGSTFNLARDKKIFADSGASLEFNGSRIFGNNSTFQILDGASLNVIDGYFDLGNALGSATLKIEDGGAASIDHFSYVGAGLGADVTVSSSGYLQYQNGFTILANGNMLVDASGHVASFGTTTVAGGNLDVVSTGNFQLGDDVQFFANNNADVNFTQSRSIGNGQAYYVQSGAKMIFGNSLSAGTSGGAGSVSVSGLGSRIEVGEFGRFGFNGQSGSLLVENGGSALFGELHLASSSVTDSNGSATIKSAGLVFSNGDIEVGTRGLTGQAGAITVSGTGSLLQSNFGDLKIGADSNSIGNVHIANGGMVSIGNSVELNPTGTLTLQGGTLQTGGFIDNGGTFNFDSGELILVGDHAIEPGLAFGSNLELNATRRLTVTGTATIAPFYELTLDGGKFTVGDLSIEDGGALTFKKGTIEFNSSDSTFSISSTGALGDSVDLDNQQHIVVLNAAAIDGGGRLTVRDGASFNSAVLNNFGEIQLSGNNARVASLLPSSLANIKNSGTIHGTGRIEGRFQNQSGGLMSVNDFGRITFSQEVTNDAGAIITGRGAYVAPGIENYGQMLFSGGFADILSDITCYDGSQFIVSGGGTATVFGPAEFMDGAELRISELSNAVFFDHVDLRQGSILSGSGNAYFEGGLSIGNSPTRQEFSFGVTLGASSDLLLEIAGIDSELPEFDQYIFLKDLSLEGGSLTVDLIGLNDGDPDYMPAIGDTFDFIDVSGDWVGTFGTINLPELSPGLAWDLSGLYTDGSIQIVAAVPEPQTIGLIIIAFASLANVRRRARK